LAPPKRANWRLRACLQLVWQKKALEALDGIKALRRQQPIFLEVGLPKHSVGLVLDPSTGKISYFDPNYGLSNNANGMDDIFKHWISEYRADGDRVEWAYLTLR
jgi:hypothetical protein